MAQGCRRIVVCSLLAAALAASLPATGRAAGTAPFKTLEPGKLKVCLYPGFAPFASKDEKGKWQGWDVDYLAAFARANELDLEVIEKDFDGIWLEPGKDVCDIAGTGISDTKDRRQATGSAAVWSNTYYHPADQGSLRLYVATDRGVFRSVDGGRSWQAWSEGLYPGVLSVELLLFSPKRLLRLVTHGNGIWQRPLP